MDISLAEEFKPILSTAQHSPIRRSILLDAEVQLDGRGKELAIVGDLRCPRYEEASVPPDKDPTRMRGKAAAVLARE